LKKNDGILFITQQLKKFTPELREFQVLIDLLYGYDSFSIKNIYNNIDLNNNNNNNNNKLVNNNTNKIELGKIIDEKKEEENNNDNKNKIKEINNEKIIDENEEKFEKYYKLEKEKEEKEKYEEEKEEEEEEEELYFGKKKKNFKIFIEHEYEISEGFKNPHFLIPIFNNIIKLKEIKDKKHVIKNLFQIFDLGKFNIIIIIIIII
jgi:hypothetical protein